MSTNGWIDGLDLTGDDQQLYFTLQIVRLLKSAYTSMLTVLLDTFTTDLCFYSYLPFPHPITLTGA